MANRDYYGTENPEPWMPQNATQNQGNPGTAVTSSDPNREPFYNPQGQQEPQNMYYEQQQQQQQQQQPPAYDANKYPYSQGQQDGERGLGATVVGATGGAFLGHHFGKQSGHGTLGTVGGGLAGAVMANAVEHAVSNNHHHGRRDRHDRVRDRLERRLDRLG